MKFVTVEQLESGYFLDPRPYLAQLDQLRDLLPPGARSFADEPGHYDFSSTKCIKDLALSEAVVRDAQDRVYVELHFLPNRF